MTMPRRAAPGIGLVGAAFVDRYIRLYYRMWADLAALALRAEEWSAASADEREPI